MTEKHCSFLIVLLLLLLFCLFCIIPAIADTNTEYWAPWVTNTNTTSATINWHGENDGAGSIDYATSDYYNQHQSFEDTVTSGVTGAYQHVQLTGLEPDTTYIYHVTPSGNADVYGNRMFQTMPVSGPFTFIVISDSQEGDNYTEWMRFKYVAEAIGNESDVLFILHGGDYAGHDSQDLWNTYFQVADPMLAKFAIFTTIGNHEYHNGSGNTPTDAYQYHSSYVAPLNYSFDCSDVRFIVLDSPDPDNANGDDPHTSLVLATSQEDWLNEQLDNNLAGTFTIHHHPIWDYYANTSNPNLQPWETLYHTYNISATFAGHTHNYQRYSVMGIPYFIVGDAGGQCADLVSNNTPPVWYQFGETRVLGYLKVTVDPAHNTATAQEIIIASVQEDDDNETPYVYPQPDIIDTFTFPLKINPSPPKPTLVADFKVSPVTGTAPLTVKCTDNSTGNPTLMVYNFGDGVNITGPNPVHTYKYPGIYTITLSVMKYNPVSNSIISSVATKTNIITVNRVPTTSLIAKFTASPVNGTAPLKVSFTDQSTGSPTFVNYDFGDGVNSTSKDPVHTYRYPGVYNVTLTILKKDAGTGLMLSNISIQKDLIRVN
jgi:PKD repeat protein